MSTVGTTSNADEFFKHCFICNKYIDGIVDMYLYKDMPFCSNECRSKEMDKDDKDEKPKKKRLKKKKIDNKNSRMRKNYKPMRAPVHKE